MTTLATKGPHIEDETLAAFAEGRLKRQEITAVLGHLDQCSACMRALEAAIDSVSEEATVAPSRNFRTGWLAAAAVVAVALLTIPIARDAFRPRSSMDRLVALSPRSARVVEPRLSGGFPWAAYRGPMRASDPATETERLKLFGEAGELAERAQAEGTPESQHAAGVAMVLIERPMEGVARLRAAAEASPQDAKAWSDLAAAQYAAALRLDRPSLYPEALAAADRALRVDEKLAEALFNRALILERLGLSMEARAAWQRYLEVDPNSEWSAEARERLSRLRATTGESQFKRDLPRLEQAAMAGDAATVAQLVEAHRQQSRAFAEVEHLGRWAEATQSGDTASAAKHLTVARAIGDALLKISGEALLREAVTAIDSADDAKRAALADAHLTYRRGRMTYSRHRLAEAEPDLRKAAEGFAAGASPMALVARYYAASTAFDQKQVSRARTELATLMSEADAFPRFIALGAQVRWELALCYITDGDWASTLPLLTDAETGFRRLGERANMGFVQTLLADTLTSIGRLDESWAVRIRSFETQSAEGRGDRLPVSLGGAARMELRAGRLHAARALLALDKSASRAAQNDSLVADALVREAMLDARLDDRESAARSVTEAAAVVQKIADHSLRARAAADVQFVTAALALATDPARAKKLLTDAIAAYRAMEMPVFLPESHLLRGRAALRLGDHADAGRELENGIVALERHRVDFAGGVIGTGVLDAGNALFDEAIELSLDNGDTAAAFAYAERSRGQVRPEAGVSTISVSELQRRLAGSGTAVLEVVVLPQELIAICITANDVTVARKKMPAADVASLAARSNDSEDALKTLYELVIRPAEASLRGVRQVIIVPDPLLESVPFAALYDATAKRYLIERMPVAIAASAASLRPSGNHAPQSLAAIALPSGERMSTIALPESASEIADLRNVYATSTSLSAERATFPAFVDAATKAEVVHIAGHTERLPGAGEPALIFAGRERVSWKTIAATPMSRRPSVVVLAACETLRAPEAAVQERALSLGGGFLAAGVDDVIGTLTPIADADARELFRAVHRQLAAGAGAAEAVRRAQLDALRGESRHRIGWRSVALLTNRIPAPGV